MTALDVFSYGGGVQSTAALVLAARGEIEARAFVFANVGEDSENPDTLRYVDEVARPYAATHDIDLVELRKTRFGQPETLYQQLRRDSRSIGIPVRMPDTGAPGRRNCTAEFKIRVIARWLKERGATAENPATVSLGISMDEIERARSDSGVSWERLAYPLLDLRLYRDSCEAVIRAAGLPIPPKSSCWFCPFHTVGNWREQRRRQPGLFAKAVELEDLLNRRRAELGRDPIRFHRSLKPLSVAVQDGGQLDLFDGCESGYCWT